MSISKAVIMAGGAGQRMTPLSEFIPKCYLPIYDKPLLIKQIEWLKMAGVTHVILTINDIFYNIINAIINNIKISNIKIDIVTESGVPGVASSLLCLQDRLAGEQFLFLFGDEYFDNPLFFEGIGQIKGINNILGITRYTKADQIVQGCNLILDDGKKQILKLIEKPSKEEIVSDWCWNGVAVFEKSIMEELHILVNRTLKTTNQVLIDAINNLINKGTAFGYIKDYSCNINLTNLDDYYTAFNLEYKARKGDIK